MKVTFQWIRDYVDFPGSPEEMAGRLTLAGFDVEDVVAIGQDARLEVDVPSNRPDCLGVLGLARELAALEGLPLKSPRAEPAAAGPDVAGLVGVAVEDAKLCPRYTARLVRGVRVGPSPGWLRGRLEAVGVTPVNNVVDVTNYVLYECGQPLHAFDAGRLRGGRIVVRPGRPGEKLVAINGRELAAGPGIPVIADAQGPVAFAGIMGGKATEIGDATRDVLLESAQFDPVAVRRGGRALGLASDSSYRFERGVAWEGVEWASRRAAALILEVAGGELCRGVVDAAAAAPPSRRIAFRRERCERVLGMPCPEAEVRRILEGIGCRIAGAAETGLEVGVPEHRRDLQREADLIEEVARLSGYDRIPITPHIPIVVTEPDPQGEAETRLRERLVALGYQEALTPSFGEADTAADLRLEEGLEPVIVLGKGGAPDRPLRCAVAASLLAAFRTNERYGLDLPRAFEMATVYFRRAGPGEPAERPGLGMAAREDFRTVRGHVEALAEALRIPLRLVPAEGLPRPWRGLPAARLLVDDLPAGAIAEIDGPAARARNLQRGVTVVEIDLPAWIGHGSLERKHRDFPRVPVIGRDLAVVVDAALPWARIAETVRAAGPEWLERIEAFDVFRGAQVPAGRKSVAFSLTFRRPDRTLTHDEVDAAIRTVVARLESDLGARLRG